VIATTARCVECHAMMPMPAELEATTMRCGHCGATQAVPDLEARRRLLLEQQREQRLAEQARAEAEREARREAKEALAHREEKKERRRARWGLRLTSLFAMLIAPVVIAITVFDLPARLGFGDAGAGRLAQVRDQLAGAGCQPVGGIREQYATGSVSKLVSVTAGQCVRVLAAGGDGHRSLSLRLFDGEGKEVARAGDTTDPQLSYCAAAAGTLRYEVGVGPASKGRLSHLVLTCPPTPTPAAKPASPAPAGKR
jgi:DNA-directed RNA polymerase subunit M/transcription elongation factor TFIIS